MRRSTTARNRRRILAVAITAGVAMMGVAGPAAAHPDHEHPHHHHHHHHDDGHHHHHKHAR